MYTMQVFKKNKSGIRITPLTESRHYDSIEIKRKYAATKMYYPDSDYRVEIWGMQKLEYVSINDINN